MCPRNDTSIFNVHADEPGSVDAIAQVAGAEIKAQASAVSAQQVSNPIDVTLTGAEIQAKAGVIRAWPAYGAHVWSRWVVGSGYPNLVSNPLFQEWNSKCDLLCHQGRYPFTSWINDVYPAYQTIKGNNPNIKIINYSFMHLADSVNTGSQKFLGWEVYLQNSFDQNDDWNAKDPQGFPLVQDVGGINPEPFAVNPAHQFSQTGSLDTNFAAGWARHYYSKQTAVSGQNLFDFEDGTFHDSMDFRNFFPRLYRNGEVGGTIRQIDYSRNGNTNVALYRSGIKKAVDEIRLSSMGQNYANLSNGARDATAVNEPTSNNEWAGFWDGRLAENSQNDLDLDNAGDNTLVLSSGAVTVSQAIDKLLRHVLISYTMCDNTSSNRLGKAFGYLDFVGSWVGADPTSVSDVPQSQFEATRLMCGLACLDDRICAGGTLRRGVQPSPYPDEYVYDPGDAEGGVPSIGTLDETTGDLTFTRRNADSNGWYWQIYSNVGWFVNLNNPTGGGAAWPNAVVGADAITLPSPGAGLKWQFADGSYTNSNRADNRNQAENQSPLVNTGLDVGATLNCPRWCARMLVKVVA